MAPTIRLAREDDAEQILAIYGPFCYTPVSFETEPPSVQEMRRRIAALAGKLPWLVADDSGIVLAYAYASSHRSRAAYQWSVEVSAYVAEGMRRRGFGRTLYASLFQILGLQGYVNAYAGISLPNPSSVGMHEAVGFVPIGVYHGVGYKNGAWHDVGWWERPLREQASEPAPPMELKAACSTVPSLRSLLDGQPMQENGA
jgi:L-amino acid N-acyltransferase YncA